MKSINIAELKTHLSRYLRLVRQGERVAVMERGVRIAELIPSRESPRDAWQRCADDGLVTLGNQVFVGINQLDQAPAIDIQAVLRQTREER